MAEPTSAAMMYWRSGILLSIKLGRFRPKRLMLGTWREISFGSSFRDNFTVELPYNGLQGNFQKIVIERVCYIENSDTYPTSEIVQRKRGP